MSNWWKREHCGNMVPSPGPLHLCRGHLFSLLDQATLDRAAQKKDQAAFQSQAPKGTWS